MKLPILLSVLVGTTIAAPAAQSLTFHDDGSYRFYYETGKEGGSHTRSEVRSPDGVVTGKFSYEDPDGEIREVNYRADNGGFVAKGDVGVPGAPKSQFPVAQPDQPISASTQQTVVADDKPEVKQEKPPSTASVKADHHDDDHYHNSEDDNDEMQDLALEESSANDPPEAFPPGFFLEKFQGLRRLPEPTKEDKPTTTETPEEKQTQPDKEPKQDENEPVKTEVTGSGPAEDSVFTFRPIQSFPAPGIPQHQEWASTMFHQPVYVFAYHQPDSYGYHYYF